MKLDRRNQIVDMISQQRTVKNTELMERFDISIETVRRDLEYLEQQGYLRRVYGGAVVNASLSSEPEYTSRSQVRSKEKLAIAAEAAKLVQPQDSVYLGVGTTEVRMGICQRDRQGARLRWLDQGLSVVRFSGGSDTCLQCKAGPVG